MEMLTDMDLLQAKPVDTPLQASLKLEPGVGELLGDQTKYG